MKQTPYHFYHTFFFTAVLALIVLCLSGTAFAADKEPRFALPVDCELTNDCWIVKYVDVAPETGKIRDYNCGPHSEDGHEGTDIAIADYATMQKGIKVRAAASGTVLRIRDNVDDFLPSKEEIARIKAGNKACGNGIIIDHGDDWQSVYCHLKKNSIKIKPGDDVRRGQDIAEIGHSGLTEFPHLHFSIFYNGTTMEPFTGRPAAQGCGTAGSGDLWRSDLVNKAYYAPAILAAGFSPEPPDFDRIRYNVITPNEYDRRQRSLFLWVGYYGARKNDIVTFKITAPDGSVFARKTIVQEISRPRQFYYIGKNSNQTSLPEGVYTGIVTIQRPAPGENTTRTVKRYAYIR